MQLAVTLADLLAQEVREAGAFIELLREEQKLLASSGNADALMPIAERKSQFALQLRMIGDKRENFLAAHRYEPGRAGMEACLMASPDRTSLESLWRQLIALAKEARALNETNGKLIDIHWQHNQKALAALMSAAEGAMVYGPDGQQSSSTGGGRSLGSA